MADPLGRVVYQDLVHHVSPYVVGVTGCGTAFDESGAPTNDAPTCLRCIAMGDAWQVILRRAIERRTRSR